MPKDYLKDTVVLVEMKTSQTYATDYFLQETKGELLTVPKKHFKSFVIQWDRKVSFTYSFFHAKFTMVSEVDQAISSPQRPNTSSALRR